MTLLRALAVLLVVLVSSVGEIGTPAVSGYATWYAYHEGQAAAGPALRELLGGGWRGDRVRVSVGEVSVVVRLTDWCACGDRRGRQTVIDLDRRDFAKLADPVLDGIVIVMVEPVSAIPLPATDTD